MAYGTVNADVIGTSVAGSNLGAGNASIMKNRIINGAMTISQYNGTSAVTPTNAGGFTYVIDRFGYYASQASKFTFQQNAGSVTPPVGFSNYLGCTVASAVTVGASDIFAPYQFIEGFNTADLGWGTANAKTVTLSFQVYSSLTGTFGGSLINSAYNRSYPFTYSIPVANTWTTISITIAGDTTGTWIGATNGTGLRVVWGLGVGSTFSGTAGSWSGNQYWSATGAVSVVGTSGATFYITGVQLELGSYATGFEFEFYSSLLSKCQRYYYSVNSSQYNNTGLTLAMATGSTTPASRRITIPLPVPMRSQPAISFGSTAPQLYTVGLSNLSPNTGTIANYSSNIMASFDINASSAGTAGQGLWLILDSNSANQSFMASAEL